LIVSVCDPAKFLKNFPMVAMIPIYHYGETLFRHLIRIIPSISQERRAFHIRLGFFHLLSRGMVSKIVMILSRRQDYLNDSIDYKSTL